MLRARAAAARAVSGALPRAAAGPARSTRAGLGAARRSGHAAGTGLQDLILREYVRPLVGALQTIERYPLGGLRGAELARQLRRHGDEMTDAEVARTELRFLAHCLLVTTHARRSFGARLADAFPKARALRDALAPEPEDG